MQIDIKTSGVKPIRNTYAYVEKRFGDKVASRFKKPVTIFRKSCRLLDPLGLASQIHLSRVP